MCLWGGRGCEGMFSAYLMPTVCLCWFCCLAWQSSGSFSKGTDLDGKPGMLVLQGAQREMCWALSQRGSHPQWRGPSLQVIVEYQKEMCYSFMSKASRCSIQQGRGPCVFVFFFVCVRTLVCDAMHFQQPSILLSLRRKRERYQALLFLFN